MNERSGHLADVIRLFLRLGFTAFGGPAVHIAMMREEVVQRRGWLSESQFLDLLGVANLIPGPSSTELAIYLGYRQAGAAGLVAAGAAFILPATFIVLACAWGYVTYGSLPAVGRIFYGVTPVLIAIIAQALWGLGRAAIKDRLTAAVTAAAAALAVAGLHPAMLLLAGGAAVMLIRVGLRRLSGGAATRALLLGMPAGILLPAGVLAGMLAVCPSVSAAAAAAGPARVGVLALFAEFLKIGATLFGSGYVLLAFLHQDLVAHLGWLTDRQLLDAVAVGQFTPGPVFTTATFIGYLLGRGPGAAAATAGIFLPSFLFVAATYPFVGRLRESPWAGAFLDGVNATAVALMAVVTWHLARAALIDALTAGIAVAALVVLLRTRINSALLILAGGLVGVVLALAAR